MTISHARGRSRAAATSKMEHFVIIVNGFKSLTIITKRSILDVAAVLDPPLHATLIWYILLSVLEENKNLKESFLESFLLKLIWSYWTVLKETLSWMVSW